MALRSLAVMVKALPRRVPGSRAFATAPKPKGDLKSQLSAIFERSNLSRERHEKIMVLCDRISLLICVGGLGTVGYILSPVVLKI